MNTSISYAYSFRTQPQLSDRQALPNLLQATEFFSSAEADVALELLDDRLQRGAASDYWFLFIDYAEKLVGYSCYGRIACTEGSWDLYWIAVAPDYQQQGVGAALLKRSEAEIAQSGGRMIYIETSSRPQYLPTRAFYQRQGYRQEALLENFYAPGDGKIIYSKALMPV